MEVGSVFTARKGPWWVSPPVDRLPECLALSLATHLLVPLLLVAGVIWGVLRGGEARVWAVPTDPKALGARASAPGELGPDRGAHPTRPSEIAVELEPPPAEAEPGGTDPAVLPSAKAPPAASGSAAPTPSASAGPPMEAKRRPHGTDGPAIPSCAAALDAARATTPVAKGLSPLAEIDLVDALIADFRALDADGSGFVTHRELGSYAAADASLLEAELDALMFSSIDAPAEAWFGLSLCDLAVMGMRLARGHALREQVRFEVGETARDRGFLPARPALGEYVARARLR